MRIKKIKILILSLLFIAMITACSKQNGVTTTANDTGEQQGNAAEVASKNTGEDAKSGEVKYGTPEYFRKVREKNVNVKGIYLTGWILSDEKNIEKYLNIAKTTEINTFVIDIKDDDGYVGYESQVPAVREIGAWKKKYNVDKVIKVFHENGIHLIGRVACFKDPVYSAKKTEYAIRAPGGGVWKDKNFDGKWISWLNAHKKDAWQYIYDIAKEGLEKGFDEIQFDYVRFPNPNKGNPYDLGQTEKQKYETICEFLSTARQKLPEGAIISADVFAIICESPEDTEGIGQYWEYVTKEVDFVSPMAYPSHYYPGQILNKVKYEKPDLDPYGVVYNTLVKGKNRLEAAGNTNVIVRPFLQAFTAPWLGAGNYLRYGPEQMRLQIKAVYDAGYKQWIFWDPACAYNPAAFEKK